MINKLKQFYKKWDDYKQTLKNSTESKRRLLFSGLDLGETLLTALFMALFIKTFFVQTSKIPTGSMIPTLNPPLSRQMVPYINTIDKIVTAPFEKMPSDWLLVNKIIYDFREPTRGEIVVFKSPRKGEKTEWVKRCVALPGETVEVKSGRLYVDGEIIGFPGVDIRRDYSEFGPYTLPEDGFFMVGDNRGNSNDCRRWAEDPLVNRSHIKRSEIVGKAFFTFFPFSRMRVLR
ncbi:signal peptidase I [bacterium]|nr:signal peptidase I [bacterium]